MLCKNAEQIEVLFGMITFAAAMSNQLGHLVKCGDVGCGSG